MNKKPENTERVVTPEMILAGDVVRCGFDPEFDSVGEYLTALYRAMYAAALLGRGENEPYIKDWLEEFLYHWQDSGVLAGEAADLILLHVEKHRNSVNAPDLPEPQALVKNAELL